MATAEPTRADDADPGPGADPAADPRPRVPAPRGDGADSGRTGGGGDGAGDGEPERAGAEAPPAVKAAFLALRERMLRHPVLSVTALAAALHIVWFFTFANSGGDLAAQDAWSEFVGRHPDSAYNLAWYGGMHPVSYSVVSPYLMSVLGVRTTMMIAGTLSAGLLTMLLIRSRAVRNPLWASLAGLFGLLCNAASGRVTFGLGMMFGLGAVAAVFCWPHRWRYERWAKGLCAAPLAALSTMSSPVAGLFVGLVAVALFLQKRRPGAWSLGLAPAAVVALSAWLFPFSGTQPMSIGSAALPVVYSALVYAFVPRAWTTVRITSAVYGLSVLLVWLISSQIGSNITRLAMLFTGVALVAALPFTVRKSRKWYALVVSIVGFVGWIGAASANDIVHTTPAASWARELAPLVNELQQVGAERGRVEVVPARSHREASALSPYVNLARGWNRQADMERNPLFYDDTLNSANYHEWLRRWAVHFVVLPKDEPDGDGGERERELVQRGLPFLKQIWGDDNWQLFQVTNPTPLAEPDAEVRRAEQGEWTIDVKEPGRILVRVPYSPWLSLVDAEGNKLEPPEETEASKNAPEGTPKTYENVNGCVTETEETAEGDQWTLLVAPREGTYRLAAPYGLKRGTPCPEELR
ncbi:glycosyltransferase family protein [Streptomyces olivaceus]|uniref:MFS transporter n=1 Tax=Streptomyces olivaceus TaxID=47716 RepID=UPI0018A87E98|nr:MFS transporter [Streptomyces olivaceus]MBF8174071.1 MFS transporter [Streptomyces olivaceus]MBZ6173694.1 MFS transporter [Streptomyces olivaceus]MBZ6179871.1 MFS transporter [Streptomyces olivaceus]MBZ6251998.1 MFS transporter [Streptomyces olivaceus]